MAYDISALSRSEYFRRSLVPHPFRWAWESLVAAIPGWESAGPVRDLVADLSGTRTGAGAKSNGGELDFTSTTSLIDFGIVASWWLQNDMTVAIVHQPTTTAETALFVGCGGDGGSGCSYAMVYSFAANSKYSFWNDANGSGPISATTFGVGTRNVVIGRRVGGRDALPRLDLFVNGTLSATTTSTAATTSNVQAYEYSINRFGSYPGYYGIGRIGNVLLWNRALSDSEIEILSINPYGPTRQLRQDYIFLFRSIPISSQLSPDTIAASTNLTGTVSTIQDDPDSPDGTWLTATSATSAIDIRMTFPTPSIPPEGDQIFRYYVRKTAGSTVPKITAELRQANILRRVITRDVSVNSTSGQTFEALWHDTELVSTLDGSDVELRLYSNVGYTSFSVGSTPAYSSTGPLLVSSAFLTTNEVTCPATIAAGDLLVCQVVTRNLYMDSGSTMIGTGWAAFVGNTYGDNTTRVHQSLYWRVADGTEGGGTIIVRTFGNNQESMALIAIHRFTSANGFAGTPVENIAVDVGQGSSVTVSRTITPSALNQLAVCTIGLGENFPTLGSMTGATGATWTQRFHTGSSLESIDLQTADVSSGGAITGGTKMFSESNEYWSALTFCVVSAPVGVTPINTVEIGAVEWQCVTIPDASVSYTVAAATFG